MSIERERRLFEVEDNSQERKRNSNRVYLRDSEARLSMKYDTLGKLITRDTAERILESKGKSPDRSPKNVEKYGLQRLSDTWETRRSRYVRNTQNYSPRKYEYSSPKVNYVRASQIKSKQSNQSPVVKKIEVDLSNDQKKKVEEDDNVNFHDVDEIVENEKFYLVDSDHPIFLNSPTRLKKDIDNKDEIIEKYEGVLREINSEFKQSLRRNKLLEQRLEQEGIDRNADQHLIARLREENDHLRNDKRISNLTNKERDALNTEIASLSYQLNILKDRENKWHPDRANLQQSINNLELANQKLRDQEARSTREINLLLEKLNDRENKDRNFERLTAEYNTVKANYQVSILSHILIWF